LFILPADLFFYLKKIALDNAAQLYIEYNTSGKVIDQILASGVKSPLKATESRQETLGIQ
jgi:hypothetical protein